MNNIFISLYDWFEKRRSVLYVVLFLLVGFSGYYAFQIKLQEDISSFFGSDNKKETEILKNFKFKDRILVMISGSDSDRMVKEADSFTEKASELIDRGLVKSVGAGVNQQIIDSSIDFIYDNLPVFFETEDYTRMEALLTDSCLQAAVERYYSMLTSPSGFVIGEMLQRDPLNLGAHLLKKFERFDTDFAYVVYDGYIFNKDMSTLYLFLEPTNGMSDTGSNEALVDELNRLCSAPVQGDMKIECIGSPVVAVANARQIKTDTYFTQCLALLILIPLLYFSFRNKRSIPLILLPPFFGALLALAVISIFKEGISAIAIGAGTVVLGISLSYSIHIIAHSNHVNNAREVIRDLSYPLTVGCFTTIGAFVALMFTHSTLLQDMGLFAALALVGTTIFSLVFLPHFLPFNQQKGKSRLLVSIEKYNGYSFEKNKVIISGIAIVLLVCLFQYDKVAFNSDMSSINFETEELLKAEQKALGILDDESREVYVVSSGGNRDEVMQASRQLHDLFDSFQQEGLIEKYVDVCDFVLPQDLQKERIERWNAFWAEHGARVLQRLVQIGKEYGFNEVAFQGFRDLITRDYRPCSYTAEDLFRPSVLSDWIDSSELYFTMVSRISISPENKNAVYAKIDSINHTTVIDRGFFSAKMVENTNSDFNFILLVTSCLVFFTLLVTYGRLEITLLTFLPMCISWVIILGFMVIFDIKFNIVNIILSTFIFGIGDDFSIFTMDGLLRRYRNGSRLFEAHKSAIFFSAVTTIIGMGVLAFAKHPALQSIATISVLGLCVVVVVSYTVQPYLFNLLISSPAQGKRPPYTALSFVSMVGCWLLCMLECLLLNVVFVLLMVMPLCRVRKRMILRCLICGLSRLFLRFMCMLRIRYADAVKDLSQKKSLVLANRESLIDIVILLSISPKIRMLTREWVWSSLGIGHVMRYVGFSVIGNDGWEKAVRPSVSVGADDCFVVVFLGEELETQSVGRALLLAEDHEVDVVSILICGTELIAGGHNPFYIQPGEIVVEVLSYRKGQAESHAKLSEGALRVFVDSVEEERNRFEKQLGSSFNPYYRNILIGNYIYKGPVLEWYIRMSCKKEGYYDDWNTRISSEARIVEIGCGFGQRCLLLGALSGKRKVLGMEWDADKIALADHCFLKGENVRFVSMDVKSFVLPESDVFIFDSSLSRMGVEDRERILSDCVSKLVVGGEIFIKEEMSERNTLSEKFRTYIEKIMRLNRRPICLVSAGWIKRFVEEKGLSLAVECSRESVTKVVYIIRKLG